MAAIMSYEEEDTCMSYQEEEDTCMSYRRRIHACHMSRIHAYEMTTDIKEKES